ncbi:uncharacterized protein LOC126253534 [Schistocerca nitens]|uniref:uncharacterized protein LOC126253534 n=1 Tax=Schistocerca nitens TaxID=7011 RepID=UPI002117C91A|nr:uncharacterized protein LOC126253534 [Schistocerca nitens]
MFLKPRSSLFYRMGHPWTQFAHGEELSIKGDRISVSPTDRATQLVYSVDQISLRKSVVFWRNSSRPVVARVVQMSPRTLLVVLSLVLLAHQPCDGGIILDKISSFVNKFVPLQRTTTTALPPTASTSSERAAAAGSHGAGDNGTTAAPLSGPQLAVDNSTLSVTSLPDDVTTASSNSSQSKGFIIAPNLVKCGSGFRTGHNGRCHRIV